MRSTNFQLEEGKMWSLMILSTFLTRQPHNLNELDKSNPDTSQWRTLYQKPSKLVVSIVNKSLKKSRLFDT